MSDQPKPTTGGDAKCNTTSIVNAGTASSPLDEDRSCKVAANVQSAAATKPTGEWTARTVMDMIAQDANAEWNVADAHNAALAAERGNVAGASWYDQEMRQLREQLADEREKPLSSLDASKRTFNEYVHDNQQLREQLTAAQAAIKEHNGYAANICHYHIQFDTTALDAAIEQKRLEIWRDAPNQPDVQEAVIKKLDLVHRHAIAAAQKPLTDALHQIGLLAGSGECGDPPQMKLDAIARRCEKEIAKS